MRQAGQSSAETGNRIFTVYCQVRKKNRDNKTPLELFIAGVRCWEAGLRQSIIELPNGTRP
jgi:hypothetical protein